MSFGVYQACMPIYQQGLTTLQHLLDQLETYAGQYQRDMDALLALRLAPDMFDLKKQVQLACDFALTGGMKLTEREYVPVDYRDGSLSGLRQLLANTRAQLAQIDPAEVQGAELREICLNFSWGELKLPGDRFINFWSLPNFLFHVTTAYNLLRREGLPIGKADFLGQ